MKSDRSLQKPENIDSAPGATPPSRKSPDLSQHYDIDGVSLTKNGVTVSSDDNVPANEEVTGEKSTPRPLHNG